MVLFFRSTLQEIKKIVTSAGFWLAIIFSLILMMTYGIYTDNTGKSYNFISVIFNIDSSKYYEMGITRQNVFVTLTHSSLMMYAAAISALCFTGCLCQEKKNNVKRYNIFRCGKNCSVISKATAAFIMSGIAFVISAVILLIFVCTLFPDVSEGERYEMNVLMYFTNADGSTTSIYNMFGMNSIYFLQIAGMFLYGSFCGSIAFIVASFCSSIYLCVCLPFFIGYVQVSLCNSIRSSYWETGKYESIYNFVNEYLDTGMYTFFWRQNVKTWWILLSVLIVWIVAIGIYRFRLQCQTDCGGEC